MIKNDELILKLKLKIEEKKKELKGIKRFNPTTNCVLKLNGSTRNINVLEEEELCLLASELHSLNIAHKDLFNKSLMLFGYSVEEWVTDIKNKITTIEKIKTERQLKQLEKQLDELMSEDKRTELKLDEIASLLGA